MEAARLSWHYPSHILVDLFLVIRVSLTAARHGEVGAS